VHVGEVARAAGQAPHGGLPAHAGPRLRQIRPPHHALRVP
jgi:hypothetical protein